MTARIALAVMTFIRENSEKLAGCIGHQFNPVKPAEIPGRSQPRGRKCDHCGGFENPVEAVHAKMGLGHRRGSHGGPDRPGDDPGIRLAGVEDEHRADG